MVFPQHTRVIYDSNPLVEVICQVRFPPILRIGIEVPAQIQDQLRKDYPLFEQKSLAKYPPGLPKAILDLMRTNEQMQGATTAYAFASSDNNWTISLAREFLSLSCKKYHRWEDFRVRFENVLAEFEKVYAPSFITRVGLRYQDLIEKEGLGLKDTAWAELLNSYVAGEMGATSVAEALEERLTNILVRLDQTSQVRIRHGLASRQGSTETGYLIDSDFNSTIRLEIKHVCSRLDSFNAEAGRLFRWCITDKLHAAMGPKPVPGM